VNPSRKPRDPAYVFPFSSGAAVNNLVSNLNKANPAYLNYFDRIGSLRDLG